MLIHDVDVLDIPVYYGAGNTTGADLFVGLMRNWSCGGADREVWTGIGIRSPSSPCDEHLKMAEGCGGLEENVELSGVKQNRALLVP